MMSKRPLLLAPLLLAPSGVWASMPELVDATSHPLAYLCIAIFVIAYLAVMAEEKLHLRKSKPVILAAGLIWVLAATIATEQGVAHEAVHKAIMYNLEEYSSMFLFLLVAMTFINAMEERQVFAALRDWMVNQGYSYRMLFWVTGVLAFFISPIADNLTTALLMGAVIMAMGSGSPQFVSLAMINVVVAANAGGAFSPFGDITTLMVWQAGKIEFFQFFALFMPSVVNFIVPAVIMGLFVPKGRPPANEGVVARMRTGGAGMCLLFLLTIAMAVTFEHALGLPPFMGMMTGLSLLMFYCYHLKRQGTHSQVENRNDMNPMMPLDANEFEQKNVDIFTQVPRAEWDTLLFFFGIIFSVGGLGYLGYLELASVRMYTDLGPDFTNITAGIVSAIVDNIPVMFAVLSMNPEMDSFQWLLITLTAGVGGSLLSIGSAAGVALMGASKGKYTFLGHLRWSWAIALGYIASIGLHYLWNSPV